MRRPDRTRSSGRTGWRAAAGAVVAALLVGLLGSAGAAAQADTTQAVPDTTQAAPDTTLATPDTTAMADLSAFAIRQAHAAVPEARLYVEALDGQGTPVPAFPPSRLTVSVGPERVPVTGVEPFAESGEGTAYVFLIDVSRSLSSGQFAQIREALSTWVAALEPADRAAIVTFGEQVQTVVDFTDDRGKLEDSLGVVAPTDDRTKLYAGIAHALRLSRRADETLPTRRVILTLSDGRDDDPLGLTLDELVASLDEDPVPIYAIGFYNPPASPEKDAGLRTLGRLARASGGVLQQADAPIPDVYEQLRARLDGVATVRLDCSGCPTDGRVYPVEATLRAGSGALRDAVDVRFRAVEPMAEMEDLEDDGERWWLWAAFVALGLVGLGLVVLMRRRTRTSSDPPDAAPPPAAAAPETGATASQPDGPADRKDADASPEAPSEPATLAHPATAPPAPRPPAPAPPARPVPRVTLTAIGRDAERYDVALDGRKTIGRSAQRADVVIPGDTEISGTHCALYVENERAWVVDLGSTNGTLLNGVRLTGTSHPLEDDDVLHLGRTQLRVTVAGLS